ncbi:hypothetical protein SAMN04489729_7228 [Amycolatopsis lurida]|uniref:DUF6801 domain-containing protein n=1 Tax=Amycolatopsis lurida NRRL 2430 TaxID=1460371 RepID=A0A2P2FJF1_AMYLU|nr:DUF6801 domain-containing protein [Amycolatopsis lurida]KFU76841.1 hypothetical protein BB31_34235 [Amycolatopsis lurida NRRL 2430]SEE36009.1 hypothetical protein SAMN04489729_7228 [Amycolatopsis lurida]
MTQQVRRALGRFPVLAGVILLVGVSGALSSSAATDPATPPPAPLQGATSAHQSLANACVFPDPAGERPVTMDVQATLPKVVQTGKPVQIKDFSLTFTIAEGSLGAVTEVAGGATVELMAANGDKKTPVPVSLTIPAAKVPATGELKLVATGTVPDIVLNVPSELRLSTGAPSLALTAAETPLKPITCVQAPDQKTLLGSVTLLPLGKPEPGPGKPGEPKKPGAGARSADDVHAGALYPIALQPFELQGTSTITKLGAFARLKPAFMVNAVWHVDLENTEGPGKITGSVMMPPSSITFLGFGFVPITATMELLPEDYATGNHIIDVDGVSIPEPEGSSTVLTPLKVYGKLSGVTINGVGLDVGDNCLTAEPIKINLRGEKYGMFTGGVVRTDPKWTDPAYRDFTLPPFSGCGVKEDLDSLLTGMASGPGNQACVGVNQVGLPWDLERKCPNVDPPVARR